MRGTRWESSPLRTSSTQATSRTMRSMALGSRSSVLMSLPSRATSRTESWMGMERSTSLVRVSASEESSLMAKRRAGSWRLDPRNRSRASILTTSEMGLAHSPLKIAFIEETGDWARWRVLECSSKVLLPSTAPLFRATKRELAASSTPTPKSDISVASRTGRETGLGSVPYLERFTSEGGSMARNLD